MTDKPLRCTCGYQDSTRLIEWNIRLKKAKRFAQRVLENNKRICAEKKANEFKPEYKRHGI